MWMLLGLLVFLYGWVILRRWWAWLKLKPVVVPATYQPKTTLSVIIALRNEETHISDLLQDLNNQQYPAHLLEVILVDDHSEDSTVKVILAKAPEFKFKYRLVKLSEVTTLTGKKAAIGSGIASAAGELLVFTDGDCRVPPQWLQHLEYLYTSRQAKFISGPVRYHHSNNIFKQMQLLEFASLIGTGGSSIALGKPNMCNGANMAYPREIFNQIGGFSGNDHIPSGDDEFIMHKVQRLYPGKIFFLKASAATVVTDAKSSLTDFLAQRTRWASKWPAYQKANIKALAVLVFSINFGLFLAALAVLLGFAEYKPLLLLLSFKILIDILFLVPVLQFFRKGKYWVGIIPLQIIYIPYVVLTALAGLKGTYSWKGRQIRKN